MLGEEIDWRDKAEELTTSEEYKYMLQYDKCTDCKFVVGPEGSETRVFKAHRAHVARKSSVLETMMMESEILEPITIVRIINCTPTIFKYLLDFIYVKPLTSSFHETQDLMHAAQSYQMRKLVKICEDRLIDIISPETIWSALAMAFLLQDQRIKEKCTQILCWETFQCITHETFLQATEESIVLLLQQDEVNVSNEELLVNSIVFWAKHAACQRGLPDNDSSIRAVLKPRILPLMRLLTMSPQQFRLGPGISGWLTSEEKVSIFECLRTKTISSLPKHLSAVTKKRQVHFICQRTRLASRPNVQQNVLMHATGDNIMQVTSTLMFQVNMCCLISGVRCSSRYKPLEPAALSTTESVYWETIEIFHCEYDERSLSTEYNRRESLIHRFEQYVPYNSTIMIRFDTPFVYVDRWEAIELRFKQETSRTKKPLGEYPNPSRALEVHTDCALKFEFHPGTLEGYYTSQNDGLIKSLIFSPA